MSSDIEEPHGSDCQADATISAEVVGSGGAPPPAAPPSAVSDAESNNQVCARNEAGAKATRTDSLDKRRFRDRLYYFKRSKAAWWLLALCILMLVGAFLLYPRRAAVYRPSPLSVYVTLFKAKTVHIIEIDVSQPSSTVSLLDFTIDFSAPKSSTALPTPRVKLIVSFGNRQLVGYASAKEISGIYWTATLMLLLGARAWLGMLMALPLRRSFR